MLFWSFYFLAKSFLYFAGNLQFDILANGLLILYWITPMVIERALKSKGGGTPLSSRLLKAHLALGLVLAFAVLWHDSYFPPLSSLFAFLTEAGSPSLEFIGTFLLGLFEVKKIAALLAIFWFCKQAKARDWAITPIVVICLIIPSARAVLDQKKDLVDIEKSFYSAQEKMKAVTIETPDPKAKPFDVVIIQVCSLAWDDLMTIGMEKTPFYNQFDLLFTRFNTVTSYSTPSALRLLRSNCGQIHHSSLYKKAPEECYLMEALRKAGYKTQTLFNNDGELATKMADEMVQFGAADRPTSLKGYEAEAVNFDGSHLYNNLTLLKDWLKNRDASTDARAALYYNTVSLHGGTHLIHDSRQWWKIARKDHYKEALNRLFTELGGFFKLLDASKRDTLVIVVSEHGAALEGNSVQAQDLRDIPLPRITTVPMAVKFFHQGKPQMEVKKIDRLVSYPAITTVIREAMKRNKNGDLDLSHPDVIASIPTSEFFAENQNASTTVYQNELFYRGNNSVWKKLPKELLPQNL